MNKKYTLTDKTIEINGHILYRIQAIKDFGKIKKGDLGGWIESESNLSHEGNCWIYNEAKVFEKVKISDDALIFGHAIIYGNAKVYQYAKVFGHADIHDYAQIYGHAMVYDNTYIYDNARVFDNAKVFGHAKIFNYAKVYGYSQVFNYARVYSYTQIRGDAIISKTKDYFLIKNDNNRSCYRYFTYTISNNMWAIGYCYGTSSELFTKAYQYNGLSGRLYEQYAKFVEKFRRLKN